MISPSDHEEADTRGPLHTRHKKIHGINSIMMRTCDTDLLVLAIAAQYFLQLDEFWLPLGWVEVINTSLSIIFYINLVTYFEFIPAFRVLFEMSPTKEDIDAIFPLLNKFSGILYQNNDVFQQINSLRLHLLIYKGNHLIVCLLVVTP